ncbi:MAG TPA: GyrI-like domain-containing protein [Bacillota bacterium]|nr:GyrI-like domain-containing protein [Bacillota bacterium]HOA15926.1 GyrI-like domain-containing protein [Bacillota bacterium]HOG52270.1 GyrI-like domain-containing protein [Bacillota bacterium]
MSDGVEVLDVDGADVVFIRIKADIKDIPWQINQIHELLREHIEGKGMEANGQKYAAYHCLDTGSFDIEVGITTSKPVEGVEGISSGRIAAGKALQAKYIGAHIPVIMTYNYLNRWMDENGYIADGPRYEFYDGEYFDPADSHMTTTVRIPVEKVG